MYSDTGLAKTTAPQLSFLQKKLHFQHISKHFGLRPRQETCSTSAKAVWWQQQWRQQRDTIIRLLNAHEPTAHWKAEELHCTVVFLGVSNPKHLSNISPVFMPQIHLSGSDYDALKPDLINSKVREIYKPGTCTYHAKSSQISLPKLKWMKSP